MNDETLVLITLVMVFSFIGSWFTHIVHCIANQEWIFLLAGAIMAPIGIIHGYGLWFGFFN